MRLPAENGPEDRADRLRWSSHLIVPSLGALTTARAVPQHERTVTDRSRLPLATLAANLGLLCHWPEVLPRVSIVDGRYGDLLLRVRSLSREKHVLLLLRNLRRLLCRTDLLSDGRRHGSVSVALAMLLVVERVRMEDDCGRLLGILLSRHVQVTLAGIVREQAWRGEHNLVQLRQLNLRLVTA